MRVRVRRAVAKEKPWSASVHPHEARKTFRTEEAMTTDYTSRAEKTRGSK